MLRAAGIVVDTGVMEAESRRALAAYLTRQTKKRPYVILKLAVSADGRIGHLGSGQVAITGPTSRAQVHALRAETDAILVGAGTAIADDPELTCRLSGLEQYSPIRIVFDRRLELPVTGKLVRTARQVPVIAVAGEPPSLDDDPDEAFQARRDALVAAGVEVLQCDPDRIERAVSGIARRLESSGETDITSEEIGLQVLEALKSLDDVAFVRYASVYRDFSHAEDFEKVINEINAKIGRDSGADA